THTFRANVDHDRLQEHAADAVTLVVQGELTGSDTDGEQLWADIDEAEGATGRAGFFPRPPVYAPVDDDPAFVPDDGFDRRRDGDDPARRRRVLSYHRSSLFYQVTYTQEQIARFLAYPPARRWEALAQAFGVRPAAWGNGLHRASWHLLHLPEAL